MQKYMEKIFKYRYVIGIIILVICVIFEINGSSIGCWNYYFEELGDLNDGVIIGNSRKIRSDEWMVNTPITLSQYYNDFKYNTQIQRACDTDVFLISEQPVKDISMIFRLFQVGYLFLSPEKGLSLFWCSRIIVLFLATLDFSMLLTNKNKKLSLMSAMLITCAPIIQWWYATNTLIEMIVYAEIAIIIIDKYMNTDKFWYRFFYSLIILICAGSFALCLYPAWLVVMVYIFLPALIWVIYKNYKNFKFSVKNIICFIVQALIIIGLILRIFIKSWDMISIMLNTAYPGNRISKGGFEIFRNIIYQIGILLPFKNKIGNPCEMVAFIDFWPITMIMVAMYFIKEKKKDLYLIISSIIYIFLGIYITIGIPEFLAKITLLSFTPPERLSGIIGILTIFILIRVLSLTSENYVDKKLAIFLSILFATFFSIVVFFAVKPLVYQIDIENQKEIFMRYINISDVIIMTVVFSILYYLLLQIKNKKCENIFIAISMIICFILAFGVNPIRIGDDVITQNKYGKKAQEINSKQNGNWITLDISGNFLVSFGIPTINSTNVYPNLDLWKKIDINNKYENIYNRYAHIEINLSNEKESKFELVQEDFIVLTTNIDTLYDIGVRYIFDAYTYYNSDNADIRGDKCEMKEIYSEDNVKIYELVDINDSI